VKEIALSEVVYREDLYPRFKPNPQKIQEYADNLDRLPPIEIDQHNILIDGYHRWKAYETAKLESIPCVVTEIKSEAELERLAVERNSKHGQQLTQDEKKKYAVRWWDVIPDSDILETLSVSQATFSRWTKDKRQQKEQEIKQHIYDMWMACIEPPQIAKTLEGVDERTIQRKIAEIRQNDQMNNLSLFSNFEPKVYTTWNIQKLSNKAKVFGSIPSEIIDNLLYYYTKPFDVVFDPFGGGGSTIDVCIERKRRYYVSDLTPIPARPDIRRWDITQGLPDDLPVPDFVFLDPPYWKQAEKKYSEKDTDLSNIGLDSFLNTIADIAKAVKRKWNSNRPDARLAIIIGPFYREGEYVDLPMLCYQTISKYLDITERISVPYPSQVVGGDEVNKAKADKRMIHLIRDLMIFKNRGSNELSAAE
jgi:hypothetical protein